MLGSGRPIVPSALFCDYQRLNAKRRAFNLLCGRLVWLMPILYLQSITPSCSGHAAQTLNVFMPGHRFSEPCPATQTSRINSVSLSRRMYIDPSFPALGKSTGRSSIVLLNLLNAKALGYVLCCELTDKWMYSGFQRFVIKSKTTEPCQV